MIRKEASVQWLAHLHTLTSLRWLWARRQLRSVAVCKQPVSFQETRLEKVRILLEFVLDLLHQLYLLKSVSDWPFQVLVPWVTHIQIHERLCARSAVSTDGFHSDCLCGWWGTCGPSCGLLSPLSCPQWTGAAPGVCNHIECQKARLLTFAFFLPSIQQERDKHVQSRKVF